MTRLLVVLGVLAGIMAPAFAQETVAVVNRTIYPGETVEAGAIDEVIVRGPVRTREAVALSAFEIEGKVARRTLLPNRYIPLSSLRDAFVVERGKQARLVFQYGALSISTDGVALESGAAGDLIRIRNVDSGAIVSGAVMADGTVRIAAQ